MDPLSSLTPALPGSRRRAAVLTALAAALLLPALGCHGTPGTPGDSAHSQTDQQRRLNEEVRQELEMIPPPVKAKFMNIKSLDSWENPYLTVQDNLLVLHVTIADANPADYGRGGLLRPVGARRQTLTIRTAELPAALNAVPAGAWPYGRVIAVEEAHGIPANAEREARRTMEQVMATLNQLGVVMYEWGEGGPGIR